MKPVFVSADTTRSVFSWIDAIEALRDAYRAGVTPATVPARSMAKEGPAWLRVLPAMPAGRRYFGAKLMGSPGATTPPVIEYVIVLFDRETGSIAAFLDANVITGLRTAATSAVAADLLLAPGPVKAAVLGSGFEAAMHARALAAVRPISELVVFSPNPQRRGAFAAEIGAELGISCRVAAAPEVAVAGTDVVMATARSHGEVPILFGSWMGETAVVISIGSTIPQQREVDISVVESADLIVCDSVEEVAESTGDMLACTSAGVEFRPKTMSLSEALTASGASRIAVSRRPMFKSIGSGLQDVVVSEMVLTKALAAGKTTPLPMTFETKG